MKISVFRNWVHDRWLEHCEDVLLYGHGDRLLESVYWQKTKWWLKNEWRQQARKNNERIAINERYERWTQ